MEEKALFAQFYKTNFAVTFSFASYIFCQNITSIQDGYSKIQSVFIFRLTDNRHERKEVRNRGELVWKAPRD